MTFAIDSIINRICLNGTAISLSDLRKDISLEREGMFLMNYVILRENAVPCGQAR